MSAKSAKRARKKERHRQAIRRCEDCGSRVQEDPLGEHDSALSAGRTTWDGVVIVAWCIHCGHEYCS